MSRQRGLRGLLMPVVALTVMVGALSAIAPVLAADEIDGLRAQRDELARQAADVASEIDKLGADDQAVVDALADLDAFIVVQENRIAASEAAIAAAEADADAARRAAEQLGVEMEAIRERMRQRAIDAFIQPREEVVSHLANDDLTESVVKRYLLDTVVGSEIDSVDDYREAEALREAAQRDADTAAAAAEAERASQAGRLAELEDARAEAEAIRAEIQRRVSEWEAVGDDIEAADRAIENEIREIEEAQRRAAVEAARRQAEADNRSASEAARAALPDIDVGDFRLTTWPVPGRITSGFGSRVHPIFGSVRQHNGVDMDADSGDPIGAALSGVVITAGVRSGYGNTVVVSHGGGFTTLYAHMSEIKVSAGTEVSSGDLLGLVGSTGWSTGPHLHFEVRVDGVAIDPLPFLP